jgi:hypothetical protein
LTELKPNAPLLYGVSQYEVDFVIPRVGVDLPLGIDPFLLFKSRDPYLSSLHKNILDSFNHGINLVREGNIQGARNLFEFPEASEIGLGYTKKGKRGSGVGVFLAELIIETLSDSPALIERGVRHIEEMQLVSIGIGPDRISDMAANLLKKHLIEYTQKQCDIWKIPVMKNVPIEHIFDLNDCSWYDDHFNLPISPYDAKPILLVPRRIVRTLPWINYDDFFRMEFANYLRAKRVHGRLNTKVQKTTQPAPSEKNKIVQLTRKEVERIDRYIAAKEDAATDAQPSLTYLDIETACPESDSLKQKLSTLRNGNETAVEYQKLILEILNYLFNPELIDGKLEVRTIDGTERRDIIFTNDSDQPFWSYLRTEHSAVFIMFETKNTNDLNNIHFNQTATYLGDRIGRLAFIVTRSSMQAAQQRKAFSIYNDSHPRKIILVLSDIDIIEMLDMKCAGKNPMRYLQKLYRSFRTSVQ